MPYPPDGAEPEVDGVLGVELFELEDFDDELDDDSELVELVVFDGSLLVFGGGFCDDFELEVVVSWLGVEYSTGGGFGALVVWLLFTFEGPGGQDVQPWELVQDEPDVRYAGVAEVGGVVRVVRRGTLDAAVGELGQ
ncbi:hypothetical protein ACFQ1S_28130 [Kibdelosporangium lantanae]|uniref:Uncharacterized protein n=1 Tax=Kibdelosporangium lantanae TaxID=1497396 RepID=A0ABW3MI77_9PSEU